MPVDASFDVSVVGSGPNGLSAAVEMARNGRKVLLVESADRIGGGTRTEELTLPGYLHDVCSAIHPTGLASPFFAEIDLDIEWIHPPIPLVHPLDGGRAVALYRSVDETALQFGDDADRYRRFMGPLVEAVSDLVGVALSPMRVPPKNLGALIRTALAGGPPAAAVAMRFSTREAKALLAGLAAHSISAFNALATAGVGVVLGAIGHASGWPLVRGGSVGIANALADRLTSLGGVIETGRHVSRVEELPGDTHLLDVMPPAARSMAVTRISGSASRRLGGWKPGPGVFKVDYALDAPVPWADPLSGQAGTVHLGGTYEEIRDSEAQVIAGEHPDRPFVLVAQQSLFDPSRAPDGKHTLWAYCHVPNGSTVDMTGAIESQIERFAPGFRDVVAHRSVMGPAEYQAHNANLVGGDIGGGRFGIRKVLQLGLRRPYDLGGGVYLCSSATPPGAGVHGMCGFAAARAALA
ncbi:MAG: NAD(P)/FAD-dependent oxidoreductase [Acidimicrobiales bacterium]|nr:NAD(P)/FAD-dependent oxidoreductase [Acidimicrobiales bacterium]HLV90046.1 NAD(P)/FAD-dependent oxidoreductase [Acidimicrobiia bacterium]